MGAAALLKAVWWDLRLASLLTHLFVFLCFVFLLVNEISRGTVEGICVKFTGKTVWSLARMNLSVTAKGQRSRSPETKTRCALPSPPAATEWNTLAANNVTQQ